MPGPSITSIIDLVAVDRREQRVQGELEGSLLMASLIIESGRRAAAHGAGLAEFCDQVEAMLREHTEPAGFDEKGRDRA